MIKSIGAKVVAMMAVLGIVFLVVIVTNITAFSSIKENNDMVNLYFALDEAENETVVAFQQAQLYSNLSYFKKDTDEIELMRTKLDTAIAGMRTGLEELNAICVSIGDEELLAQYQDVYSTMTSFAEFCEEVWTASTAEDYDTTKELVDNQKAQKDPVQDAIDAYDELVSAKQTAIQDMSADKISLSSRISVIFLIFSIVLVVAITLMTAKTVRPITLVTARMRKMAEGDLHTPIKKVKSRDEAGVMMQAVSDMMEQLNAMLHETSKVLGEMADGDFSQEVTGSFAGDLLPFKETLNHILHKMRGMLRQVYNATSQVESGSGQMAQLSESLASTVSEQASIMDNMNANISGLLESAEENATSATDAAKMAELAIESVTVSEQHMNDLFLAMEKIEQFSQEIEKINKTVSDIAFQTNILSLNAAVEAARAGEAGKGFAVVAGEVKALAEKSSAASHDVSELIENTVGAIRGGLDIAKETSGFMKDTVTHTQTVNERIESISQMSGQQLEKLEYIRQSMSEFSDSLTITAGASQESSATAQKLKLQSDQLADLMDHFRISA